MLPCCPLQAQSAHSLSVCPMIHLLPSPWCLCHGYANILNNMLIAGMNIHLHIGPHSGWQLGAWTQCHWRNFPPSKLLSMTHQETDHQDQCCAGMCPVKRGGDCDSGRLVLRQTKEATTINCWVFLVLSTYAQLSTLKDKANNLNFKMIPIGSW